MKGMYYYCEDKSSSMLNGYKLLAMDTKWDCVNSGGDWMKHFTSFDDIFEGLHAIVIVATGFGWSKIMYQSQYLRGMDMIPKEGSSSYFALFFLVFTIIGQFFIKNLFVGVVVTTYNR